MTDPLQNAIAEGEQAKQLSENPYFKKLLEGLDQAYFQAWKTEPDAAKREKLHGMICVLDDLRLNIKSAVDRAVQAKHQIARNEQLAEAEKLPGPRA